MQILAIIAASLFLSAGYAYDEEGSLLGLPEEYDIFGLDFREDLYKDQDIFKEGSETYEPTPDTTLEKLCQQFDLLLNNQNIDCSNLKFVPKGIRDYEHSVRKRDAEEIQPEEGSGEPEEQNVTEDIKAVKESENPAPPADEPPPEKEQDTTEVPLPVAEDAAPDAVPPESPKEEEPEVTLAEEGSATSVVPPENPTEGIVPLAASNEGLESELPASESPSEVVPVAVTSEAPKIEALSSEAPVEDIVPAVLPSETPNEEGAVSQATELSVVNGNTEVVSEVSSIPVTEGIIIKEENVPLAAVPVKGRKLTDLSEGEKSEADTAAPVPDEVAKSDAEKLNEHQSGVAIIQSAGAGAGTLEASDNAVKNMAANAEIKGAASNTRVEEPKSGESSKDTQEGRKDTKVLIILFVAVVVVGAAAFAYNFIKKRKAKKDEAARSENGGNSLQRNVNVSSKEKNDPEHGTELKPLMKPIEKPIVEYNDEKGNGKTGVN